MRTFLMFTLLLAACGGEVRVLPERHQPPSNPVVPPAPVPPDPVLPAHEGACPSAGWEPDRPAYLLTSPDGVQLVRGDGSEVMLDPGLEHVPPDVESQTTRAHARGGYVATTLSWVLLDGPAVHGSVLSVFDEQGQLLHRTVDDSWETSIRQMGEDGSLILHHYSVAEPDTYGVFQLGSGEVVLSDFQPDGLVDEQGWLRGYLGDGATPGWLHLETKSFQEAGAAFGPPLVIRPWADGFVRLAHGTSMPGRTSSRASCYRRAPATPTSTPAGCVPSTATMTASIWLTCSSARTSHSAGSG